MDADDAVHDFKELHPPAPLVMPGNNLTGGCFQCGEEGSRAMSLVFMRESGQRSTVGQFQIAPS